MPKFYLEQQYNDFTKLYQPLTRTGRMTTFDWIPRKEEKQQILLRIFPELNEKECFTLVDKFPEQPVVFFSQMRSRVIDDKLWEKISPYKKLIFRNLVNGPPIHISTEINLKKLIDIGDKMMNEINQTKNYLI
ncbi:MAG: hypothetical protein ACK5QF_19325 [Dolichospermum sp.]